MPLVMRFERKTVFDDKDGVQREGTPRTATFILCAKVTSAIDEACQCLLCPLCPHHQALPWPFDFAHRHCHQHGINCQLSLCFCASNGDEDGVVDKSPTKTATRMVLLMTISYLRKRTSPGSLTSIARSGSTSSGPSRRLRSWPTAAITPWSSGGSDPACLPRLSRTARAIRASLA